MTQQDVCPACDSKNIKLLETISTLVIAKFWSDIQQEAGDAILSYLQAEEIPDKVYIAKCHTCGLEFGNPRFAVSGEWYQKFEQYGIRWEYGQCLQDLYTCKQEILEVGCGEGYFLELASQKGHSIVGLDFNEEAIKVARSKNLEAYSWNLKELKNHVDKPFNAVTFFHVIEHLDEPEAFFADLAEIMPVGSSLHFSCPGPRRFTTHLESDKKVGLRDVWDYPPFHQTRWNQESAAKILSKFGWRLEKYVEEPFHWIGISSFLVQKTSNLSEQSSLQRKATIVTKMIQTFIPSLIYKGMSMYCMAIRENISL